MRQPHAARAERFLLTGNWNMRVLITGTEGYIGARLAPRLLGCGHDVVGLDTGFYRDGCLYLDPLGHPVGPRTLYKDLRSIAPADFEGFDAVVHLAELSNDPLGSNRPEVTFKINHEGSVHLARAARAGGVRRFVYASSCSVYGLGSGEFLDELSPPTRRPHTRNARCWSNAISLRWRARNFCVAFLRNATAYGPSPRMRFDIVLNDLCALAWTRKKIAMTSDGSPWRPIVHVEDICEAIRCTLEAPADTVNGEVFNVGDSAENYRIREIAQIVAEVFTGCEPSVGPAGWRQSQLPRVVRQDPITSTRLWLSLERAAWSGGVAESVRANRDVERRLRVPCVHSAEAVKVSSAHRPA